MNDENIYWQDKDKWLMDKLEAIFRDMDKYEREKRGYTSTEGLAFDGFIDWINRVVEEEIQNRD